MEDSFILDVQAGGKDYAFEARLIRMGYVHKFEIAIEDTIWHFEQDDEGHYRALLAPGATMPASVNVLLLQATAAAIEVLIA